VIPWCGSDLDPTPSGVNLIAFESGLSTTWRIFRSAPAPARSPLADQHECTLKRLMQSQPRGVPSQLRDAVTRAASRRPSPIIPVEVLVNARDKAVNEPTFVRACSIFLATVCHARQIGF